MKRSSKTSRKITRYVMKPIARNPVRFDKWVVLQET